MKLPVIQYRKGVTPQKRGQSHGEEFRARIHELAAIRRQRLHAWNRHFTDAVVKTLALQQLAMTDKYIPEMATEIRGIAEGAGLPLEQMVVLNNYTDFRDLPVTAENSNIDYSPAHDGCSTVAWSDGKNIWAGQTWDMHKSARPFTCVIEIDGDPSQLVLTVMGCVGLMGYNDHGVMVGVNNLNTVDAKIGVIWPALVRQNLVLQSAPAILKNIKRAPITSGRNFLVADKNSAHLMEKTPTQTVEVGRLAAQEKSFIFHTNHCLDQCTQNVEDKKQFSPTTHRRYELLQKKMPAVRNGQDMLSVMADHDEFPNSICTHFNSGIEDHSETCGGALAQLGSGSVHLWRGCVKVPNEHHALTMEFRQ